MPTIFTKIINKEIPADIVYEDEKCLAFKDINPQAPVHILVIPKTEIRSLADITPEHQELMGYLLCKVTEIAKAQNLKEGYRVIINTESHGGQTVYHLHIHIMGGRQMNWPPG
ncbi:MAG: histidine triad nucleotide-binding protein [Bdellovibrionales bacterium]|nr:histidine triad nucleotide-binding protein [Bdellovibrionales bacterium]